MLGIPKVMLFVLIILYLLVTQIKCFLQLNSKVELNILSEIIIYY